MQGIEKIKFYEENLRYMFNAAKGQIAFEDIS